MRFHLSLANTCLAIIAVAFTSFPVLAAEPVPPDNVTCINQAMTPEDREIALVMFAESTQNDQLDAEPAADLSVEDGADNAPPFASEHMAEVFELLEEAHMRCLDLYPWNSGQSEASRMYAFLGIIGDAAAKTAKLAELDLAAADGFYETHKKKLIHRNRLTAAEKTALAAHLQASSWPTDDEDLLNLTADYVETLMMKDMLRRAFDTGDYSKLERL